MRISDWSSDVCSSDLFSDLITEMNKLLEQSDYVVGEIRRRFKYVLVDEYQDTDGRQENLLRQILGDNPNVTVVGRSEEHTSELQSLMRISYAVFCLQKKKIND